MKHRIKYLFAIVASIICCGLLIWASYIQIQDHIYKGLIWNGIGIIILLSGSWIYLKELVKNQSDDNEKTDPEEIALEKNAQAKTMNVVESITFWCGTLIMLYASHESSQLSSILFAIAGTLMTIWLLITILEIIYIFKYGKNLDETKQ